MRTIGLIGGMSWESTTEYYKIINETIRSRLSGLHSAKCVLYSVDFAEIEALQQTEEWEQAARILIQAAQSLDRAGADFLVLCTNTMHKIAESITQRVSIPLLHIADPTAEKIKNANLQTVGLLGTRFTMEDSFYSGRLEKKFHLNTLIPGPEERDLIHKVIYNELCLGNIRQDSRLAYRRIIQGLVEKGAQGIILGCTEIGLLIKNTDSPVPLFDTTIIHAQAAVDWALTSSILPTTAI